MSKQKSKRKLAADAQGYSRLMGEDEAGTVRLLKSHFEAMSELAGKFNGRVVSVAGDNLLAEFASVVDAVQCALEIQQTLKARNEELPEDRRLSFRIGINLGDVIEEEGSLYGDGVNVAARIERLTEGGGICISGTAYDQVKNKIPVGYEYQGELTVKNIPDPIRAYRILPDVTGTRVGKPRRAWGNLVRGTLLATVSGVIVALFAFFLWRTYSSPPVVQEVAVAKASRGLPLPPETSVAVLPFENMSGDPDQEYLSNGLTDDIITSISKLPRLFVIARSSTIKYKGSPRT